MAKTVENSPPIHPLVVIQGALYEIVMSQHLYTRYGKDADYSLSQGQIQSRIASLVEYLEQTQKNASDTLFEQVNHLENKTRVRRRLSREIKTGVRDVWVVGSEKAGLVENACDEVVRIASLKVRAELMIAHVEISGFPQVVRMQTDVDVDP